MLDNKQFLIMDHAFSHKDFQSMKLSSGKVLSYHKNLHIAYETNQENAIEYCILGYAFQADPNRKSPIEELSPAMGKESLENIMESWSGRWLLIYEDTLYMDACGLLGVFYTEDGIISSSIHCMNIVLQQKMISPRIHHQFGLDYFPGPDTPYPNIRRLMPSQTLNLESMTPGKRTLLMHVRSYKNDDERIDAFLRYFRTLLRNFANEYKGKIMVPLTGGYDSRTLAALLEYSGIDYDTFTMEHDNIDPDDVSLPPLIAASLGKDYTYIKRVNNPSKQAFEEYDTHCAKMAIDEDRNFFAWGQYPGEDGPTAVLRAGIWECAWGKYYKKVSSCGMSISKYSKKYVNIRCRKDMRTSLEKWLNQTAQDEQALDFANRFYWEQRVGCWLSSVEQSLTVIDGMDSLQLCNCSLLLSILLNFDFDTRVQKGHQVKIIEKACPKLLEIPFATGKKEAAASDRKQIIADELTYMNSCFRYLDSVPGIKEALSHAKKTIKKFH